MKTLKRISFFAIAALFFAPAFQSCKKGDEDPGLSLRSRKARLAGEWTVTEMNMTTTTENSNSSSGGSSNSSTNISEVVYSGTSLTEYMTSTNTNSGVTNTFRDTVIYDNVTITYTIEKDGTFSKSETWTASEVETRSWGTRTFSYEKVVEVSGTWDFNEGVSEDAAAKQRVFFFYNDGTETTTMTEVRSYTDGSPSETDVDTEVFTYSYSNIAEDTWLLNKLANKEVIVDLSFSYSGETVSTTQPSGSSSFSNTSSGSTTGVGTFTATQE